MKTIRWHGGRGRGPLDHNPNTLHIETDGGIVNIDTGLHDEHGNRVTHISITADGDRYTSGGASGLGSGEGEWWVNGKRGKTGTALRIVEKKRTQARRSR